MAEERGIEKPNIKENIGKSLLDKEKFMWLVVFMVAIVLPLIIWGFVAGWNEKQFSKKNDKVASQST
jgi:cytoskeletal protein RodZ